MPDPQADSEKVGDGAQKPSKTKPSSDANPLSKFKDKWTLLFIRGFKGITVEPMMFLHAASMMMMYIIAQSLKIYKICRGTFNYDIDVCKNLTSYPVLEKEVQKIASDYGMYWVLIQTVPSVVFIMFLGPWSDRHGRKLPMILPLAGAILASIVYILSAQYEELPPLFLLVGPAFAGISGGMMTMIMAVFSYIIDVSTPETRTIRLGFVYGVWFLGSPIGSVVGGLLMESYGYTVVFIVGTIVLTFCLLYVIFKLEEAPLPPLDEDARASRGCFRDLFDVKNVIESFQCCFRKRPANKRLHLWVIIFSMCVLFLPITGEGNVRYLYTRLKFLWTEAEFSYYTASVLAVGSFGVIVVMPFLTKVIGLSDYVMAIVAIIAKIFAEVITAFSDKGWMMYCGAIPLIYECSGPPVRSLMTKCLETNEVGKAFAVLAVIESGIPVISGVMYSQVYNFTINVFPGTVFIVSSSLFGIVILVLIWLSYDNGKQDVISNNETDVEKHEEKQIQKHKPTNLNYMPDSEAKAKAVTELSTEVTISSL